MYNMLWKYNTLNEIERFLMTLNDITMSSLFRFFIAYYGIEFLSTCYLTEYMSPSFVYAKAEVNLVVENKILSLWGSGHFQRFNMKYIFLIETSIALAYNLACTSRYLHRVYVVNDSRKYRYEIRRVLTRASTNQESLFVL